MMPYKLNQIYFYLTEGCNLSCRHCWINPKYQDKDTSYPSLSFGDFKSIIDQAKPLGLTGVKLTGGEPLIHPQIERILEYIRQEGLRLTVETNGVACTPGLARAISLCKNPFVSVSIDSTEDELHDFIRGLKGALLKAKAGARNLVNAGLKPQIIMAVMRCNKDGLRDVARFAESIGAGSVKFNIVQPTARGEEMDKKGETLSLEELIDLGAWIEKTLSKETKIRIYHSHPMAFRPLGRMFAENGSCGVCAILNIIGVLGNGSYALCGIGESVPELVFGHVSRDRLADVWKDTPILNELREGLPKRLKGICAECVLKNRCLGHCVAQNYYKDKELWAPYWYCDKAYKKGLFPINRLLQKEVFA
ncbi:MAG: SynChlorMet cassette radical SAM/SPASM protein ScmF [Candidatus Omnitrophica bacterium]|nr:SynChlorMet cassette radical SAM/SPASM protein ScmF [Candidatus Omnitrophota bacterium]